MTPAQLHALTKGEIKTQRTPDANKQDKRVKRVLSPDQSRISQLFGG